MITVFIPPEITKTRRLKGEHAGLFQYNKERSTSPVWIPTEQRPAIGKAVITALARENCAPIAIAVTASHVHILARLPRKLADAKSILGRCKRLATDATILPAPIWARGAALHRSETARIN